MPLALACYVWPATAAIAKRTVELLAALILSKFVIVATLTLGVAALHGGPSPDNAVIGAAILLIAGFAPFCLLRLAPIVEAGAIAHLEGMSRRPLRAAGRAATTVAAGPAHPVVGLVLSSKSRRRAAAGRRRGRSAADGRAARRTTRPSRRPAAPVADDHRRYTFPPLERRGVLLGCRPARSSPCWSGWRAPCSSSQVGCPARRGRAGRSWSLAGVGGAAPCGREPGGPLVVLAAGRRRPGPAPARRDARSRSRAARGGPTGRGASSRRDRPGRPVRPASIWSRWRLARATSLRGGPRPAVGHVGGGRARSRAGPLSCWTSRSRSVSWRPGGRCSAPWPGPARRCGASSGSTAARRSPATGAALGRDGRPLRPGGAAAAGAGASRAGAAPGRATGSWSPSGAGHPDPTGRGWSSPSAGPTGPAPRPSAPSTSCAARSGSSTATSATPICEPGPARPRRPPGAGRAAHRPTRRRRRRDRCGPWPMATDEAWSALGPTAPGTPPTGSPSGPGSRSTRTS